MKENSTVNESQVVSLVKREWANLQANWRSWTGDMVKREYLAQIQATGAKAEINGISGSLTFLKLEHDIIDPMKMLEERALSSQRQLPKQLRHDLDKVLTQSARVVRSVDDVRTQAGHAMNKAREVENKVTRLQRDHLSDLNDIADEFESVGNRVTGLINALGGL
ncbi:hypothetical protein ACWGDS_41350 [Streptomyces sp. NPDC055059]|jgi:ABC-type transporter Mla subunit MlaD|uniref:hypothetical protein n=1 Tax=Streptomyces sp. NPDC127172 TaxID=3345382 RepID=UPI003628832A